MTLLQSDFVELLKATAAAGATPRPVEVPGWGTVYVRPLTVEEVDAAADAKPSDAGKWRIARGAARVLCNDAGERLLDPANDEHVALIARQPWTLLQRVIEAAEDRAPN